MLIYGAQMGRVIIGKISHRGELSKLKGRLYCKLVVPIGLPCDRGVVFGPLAILLAC